MQQTRSTSDGDRRRYSARQRLIRILGALGIAFLAFLMIVLALVWTMPAPVIARVFDLPPQVFALEGTVRRGHARLEEGYRLDWSVRPAFALHLRTDITVSGPDTMLGGVMTLGLGTIGLHDMTGRAGSGLLALVPGLGLTCDSRAILNVAIAAWSRTQVSAEGNARVDAGICRAAGHDVPLPALTVALSQEGTAGLATARTDAGVALGSLRVTPDRRAILTVEPQGTVLFMSAPTRSALTLKLPF